MTTMNAPHFVLFSRTGKQSKTTQDGGDWYFRLESQSGQECLEASDFEPDASRERLELLAAIRGLEALDQPSTVTLITGSRQLPRAVRQGLDYWRQRDWKWERFGERVPMKNADLWQRIDHAMQIHDVRCRHLRVDAPHVASKPQTIAGAKPTKRPQRSRRSFSTTLTSLVARTLHRTADALQRSIPEPAPNPRLTM